MNIYIGEPVVVSDMQGPCPGGFHVPLQSEWQSIKTVGISLGAWTSGGGDNFSTYLKIPYAGHRNRVLDFNYRGSAGYYWSSSDVGPNYAYNLLIDYADIIVDNYNGAVQGCTIRGFKDTPVVPDSNWTVLYQGSGSAGIFHNPTDGLISISSDGTTWYTLMDKNLGATTVYNYGDTLTENNGGKIFQRGNNYGFSGDPSYNTSLISQSSSSVDLTGYGPGNYYESSTWVTNSTLQSSSNTNLRGGVSQGTSTKSVEVQNIYIGEYRTTSLTADLTTQSLADLQAAGWTGILQNNGYSLDSNGLTPIGNTSALYYYYGDLSTDSVIELEMTGYASRNYSNHDYQYNAYCALGLATSAVGYGTSAYMAITTTGIAGTYNASNPIWMKCGTIYQNTLIGNEVSGNTAGNVNMKFKLDLKNKKVEYTITSPVSATTTGTLTDSQVQTILGYKYIRIEAGKWDATAYSHVYTAKLRIGG